MTAIRATLEIRHAGAQESEMNTAFLLVVVAIFILGFLIWRATRVTPMLRLWKDDWALVQFAESPYADILCGLAVEVRNKEGPYVFLKSEAVSPQDHLIAGSPSVRVHYKSKGKIREFVADKFPLKQNQAFEVYQTYRHFMDGGPPTLLLVAVPLPAKPMTNREIRERREVRNGELFVAWAKRIRTHT
jgi:hypothetical protein